METTVKKGTRKHGGAGIELGRNDWRIFFVDCFYPLLISQSSLPKITKPFTPKSSDFFIPLYILTSTVHALRAV